MSDTKTDADPRGELAELEQRVLDGDTNVTAAALAKARQAVEFADLRDAAAERQRQADAAAERERAVEGLRAEIAAHHTDLASVQKSYEQLVTSLATFTEHCTAWTAQREELIARARSLPVTADAKTLPALDRDFVKLALEEARGQLPRELIRMVGGRHPFRAHALHGPEHASRLRAQAEADDAEAAERLRVRNEQRQRERAESKAADAAAERALRRVPGYPG